MYLLLYIVLAVLLTVIALLLLRLRGFMQTVEVITFKIPFGNWFSVETLLSHGCKRFNIDTTIRLLLRSRELIARNEISKAAWDPPEEFSPSVYAQFEELEFRLVTSPRRKRKKRRREKPDESWDWLPESA